MAFGRPSTVYPAALLKDAVSFAKVISIGLRSGLEGGRKRSSAPADGPRLRDQARP